MTALDFGPFLGLPPDVRQRLLSGARRVEVAAGERLIYAKSAPSGCYVLLEGRLKVTQEGRVVARLVPPALFGEVGPVTSRPRNADVVADGPCAVLFLNVIALREAMADDPQFAAALREHIERPTTGRAPI